jgi:hypothetical protein
MAGDLADQMMRKKERQLKKMCVRYIAAAFVGGIIFGIGIMAMIVQPAYAERHALRLGLEASQTINADLDHELRLWRRGGSVADCIENRWLLRGCREENGHLQDALLRYQNMTGWTFEDDPDQRVLMHGWDGLDDSL